MDIKYLGLCVLFFILAQGTAWFQLNGQFFNEWFVNNKWPIIVVGGIITSWFYWEATYYSYKTFGGIVWPGRLLGFTIGILLFSGLTRVFMGEPITLKTGVCLSLAFLVILIQLFWK